jgi:hypothetical protein
LSIDQHPDVKILRNSLPLASVDDGLVHGWETCLVNVTEGVVGTPSEFSIMRDVHSGARIGGA